MNLFAVGEKEDENSEQASTTPQNFNHMTKLDLCFNGLKEVPPILEHFTNLRELYLVSNDLKKLPGFFSQLIKLELLSLTDNRLTHVPRSVIQNCEQLSALHLGSNFIKKLPKSLGRKLRNLEILNLSNNQIESVPRSVGLLTRLYRLRLQDNPVGVLPAIMCTMPMLNGQRCSRLGFENTKNDLVELGQKHEPQSLKDLCLRFVAEEMMISDE